MSKLNVRVVRHVFLTEDLYRSNTPLARSASPEKPHNLPCQVESVTQPEHLGVIIRMLRCNLS
jgi:hypothetical protein